MGFFTDLKEDLSQAVSELVPEEMNSSDTILTSEEKMVSEEEMGQEKTLFNEVSSNSMSEEASLVDDFGDLDDLLERVDSIVLPDDEEVFFVEENDLDEHIEEKGNMEFHDGLEEVDELTEELEDIVEEYREPTGEELITSKEFYEVIDEFEEAELDADTEENLFLEDDSMELEKMLENALASQDMTAMDENKQEETKGESKMSDMAETRVVSDETSVVTAGMTVNGNISSEGSLDILGSINGNIDIWGKLNINGYITGDSKASEIFADAAKITGQIHSEGSVKIGASTVIIGNITATSAVIAGAVKGDIDVKGPVILDTSAIIMGNIKSKSVQINNGAVIEGMCSQCYADVNPTSFFDDYKPEIKKGKK